MSRQLLAMMIAPLLGLFLICIGYGFLASLTTLRLGEAGESAVVVGIVSAAYFIGLTLGAIYNDWLILRVGHIRAYSSFASVVAVTVLLQGLFYDPVFWAFLRFINGWACVGVFLVVESWLLLASDQKMRGRILAIYMIALYGSGMFGQAELGTLNAWGSTAPFMVAGVLSSLSVLPMLIIPRTAPLVERVDPLSPRRLLTMTPAGFVGCFGSGIAIAAIYTLLPLYLQRIGMDIGQVGKMMAYTIFGAMVMQYPVGRWSDAWDKRGVMIVLCAGCAALSLLILMLPPSSSLLVLFLFLLGGGVFTIYPVAVSHAADRADAETLVPMIQGLLLINSLGCAVSPLVISPVMSAVGASGLFWSFCILNLSLIGFFLWRRNERAAPLTTAPFAPVTTMSTVGAELRVTDDLAKGTPDYEEAEIN